MLKVTGPFKSHATNERNASQNGSRTIFTTRHRYETHANGQKKHICSACCYMNWRGQKRHTPTPDMHEKIQTVRKDTFELSRNLETK